MSVFSGSAVESMSAVSMIDNSLAPSHEIIHVQTSRTTEPIIPTFVYHVDSYERIDG